MLNSEENLKSEKKRTSEFKQIYMLRSLKLLNYSR